MSFKLSKGLNRLWILSSLGWLAYFLIFNTDLLEVMLLGAREYPVGEAINITKHLFLYPVTFWIVLKVISWVADGFKQTPSQR